MLARWSLLAVSALFAAGCYSPGDGIDPPLESVYFPVGLATDRNASVLFVANSNFDLQYNAGTLQSLDLEQIRPLLPRPCAVDGDCPEGARCDSEVGAQNAGTPSFMCVARQGPHAGDPCGPLGQATPAERLTVPGPCRPLDPANPPAPSGRLILDAVGIGAFATDVVYRERPGAAGSGAPARLFLPVRGDATLHFVDVDEGRLECGQSTNGGSCSDYYRIGDDPEEENTRGLRLPPEPYAVDATADGRAIVVVHQTENGASLFVNDWSMPRPTYQFFLGGLPGRPVGVAHVPRPAVALARAVPHEPGFLVAFRDTPQVQLLRFYDDGVFSPNGASPARPYLVAVGGTSIAANSSGVDSRGIAVDDTIRRDAEVACLEAVGSDASCLDDAACLVSLDEAAKQCLAEAAAAGIGVYVANRSPASLLLGRTRPVENVSATDDLPYFHTTVPLTFGPSRTVVGSITNREGQREPRVFVVCFDTRRVFIYDPLRRRIETSVPTGRGPYAFVVDAENGLAYVGHFTDSYIGVLSLDQRYPVSYGTMIAAIGRPTPPRASK
jgi:hypothetical protein